MASIRVFETQADLGVALQQWKESTQPENGNSPVMAIEVFRIGPWYTYAMKTAPSQHNGAPRTHTTIEALVKDLTGHIRSHAGENDGNIILYTRTNGWSYSFDETQEHIRGVATSKGIKPELLEKTVQITGSLRGLDRAERQKFERCYQVAQKGFDRLAGNMVESPPTSTPSSEQGYN